MVVCLVIRYKSQRKTKISKFVIEIGRFARYLEKICALICLKVKLLSESGHRTVQIFYTRTR